MNKLFIVYREKDEQIMIVFMINININIKKKDSTMNGGGI